MLDILKNDSDVDTAIDPRTIILTSLPAFGTATVNQTGVVSYTPGTGFRGVDSFSYVVRDAAGNISNESTVNLTVNSIPQASNDGAFTFKNQPVTVDVLANDIDFDGVLNRSSVQLVAQPVPSGAATVLPDGRIQFTPANNFTGSVQFQYFVLDNVGSPSNIATVQLQILASAFQNPVEALDVSGDNVISAIDALLVINYINVSDPEDLFLPNAGIVPPPFLDVNGDESVSAFDALLIINYLNTQPVGEGEGVGQDAGESSTATDLSSLATPMIVTMVTAEDMVATVGPTVVQELQLALSQELQSYTSQTSSSSTSSSVLDEVAELLASDQAESGDLGDGLGVDSYFAEI